MPDSPVGQSVSRPASGPVRLYQCPGCWGYNVLPKPPAGAWMECNCGERMTLIDLRERREQPLNEDAH